MSQASLAGRPFRVNPNSVAWNYTVKTAEFTTIGGTVVQVLGAELSDMTVTGTFGVGGWEEQAQFLESMKAVADRHALRDETVRFFFPSRGWDFQVYLRSYSEPGARNSVRYANDNFSPDYSLDLIIIEDNSPVKIVQEAAVLDYMRRLTAGLGWQQTKYNGPLTESEVADYVTQQGATSVKDLLLKANVG